MGPGGRMMTDFLYSSSVKVHELKISNVSPFNVQQCYIFNSLFFTFLIQLQALVEQPQKTTNPEVETCL